MNILKKNHPIFIFFLISLGAFILFTLFPVRLDFSKGSAYTLSPSTKKIIQKNSKNVEITLYVSSDLPTRILPLKTDVVELLQEYRRGGKNIKVTIIDPKKDTKSAEKAKSLGIPELQFSQLEQNKYQTSSFYFGIVLSQGDKTELIPQVSDYQNLEYNLTSAIYRLTRSEVVKVGLVGEGSVNALKKGLSQQYEVSSVDLNAGNIDEYASLLLMDSGSQTYSSEQIQKIKKGFESGKKMLVFAGGTSIEENTLGVNPSKHNLNELIASYGAQIESNLLLSTSAEYVNFGNETSQFTTVYPFWIRSNLFDLKSGLFSNIQFLTFPWTSSLTLKSVPGVVESPLIVSSKTTWEQKNSFTLNPNSIPQPLQKNLAQFVIGAHLKHKSGGEMIIIPSSRFPFDQFLTRGGGNIDFILNSVDSLTSSGALSGIRSRIVSFYPLPELTDSQKDMYKYGGILLFPLLWGAYGVMRLMKRK